MRLADACEGGRTLIVEKVAMGKLLNEWAHMQEEQAKPTLARLREKRLNDSMAMIDHCLGHDCVIHQADVLRRMAGGSR
ncbi:MAG: hypothetical protein IPK79_07305 [Vampirovibrionales bacterium]|nr:hypothetical protein [Vampirovibrionales bacterium]